MKLEGEENNIDMNYGDLILPVALQNTPVNLINAGPTNSNLITRVFNILPSPPDWMLGLILTIGGILSRHL